ncbi:hypothetical protein ACFQX6_05960 [Streptosporangium lutulentum]
MITEAVLDETAPAGLLVRPDGFVAWASDTVGADPGSLEAALSTWLGTPAGEGANASIGESAA